MHAVLIAAKQLDLAKTRLAPALKPAERRALAEAMFRDVLGAAMGARAAGSVAVVSSDPALLKVAQAAGAKPIEEGEPRGLNEAVEMATAELERAGVTGLCTVLSDTPLLTAEDIDAALEAMDGRGDGARAVVLVPSRDCSGTNMIARTPAAVIATHFGPESLARHLEDCRALAVPCRMMRMERAALDLDLLSDLLEFARMESRTHTQIELARLGLKQG